MLFEVENLRVDYGSGARAFHAVRGVSFTLGEGETLGVAGESGSGKSTIARALMLLEPIAGGVVRWRGKSVADFTSAERRAYRHDVQMVFQDAAGSLNPRMTVRQTLDEVRVVRPDAPAPEELLDRVGLARAVLDQYPRELSGGQCQRASFARALAVCPKAIVADEPVSALDVSVQARLLNLMRDLRRELGLSIILIAHDLAVVRNVCDRVAVMHHGVFEDFGETASVFDDPQSDYTKRLLAAVPDVKRALAERTVCAAGENGI